MDQIAEFHAAEGIVAEVLDDGAAVSVTVCQLELLFRKGRKALEEQRADLIGPEKVDDFLVGEHGIGRRTRGAEKQDDKDSGQTDTPGVPTTRRNGLGEASPILFF